MISIKGGGRGGQVKTAMLDNMDGFLGTVQYRGKWAVGNGLMGNGGWMASVASGLWGRKLLGNIGFWRERRVVNLQVGYTIAYRL